MFGRLRWFFSARCKYLRVESHCIVWQANVIFPSQSSVCCSPMAPTTDQRWWIFHCHVTRGKLTSTFTPPCFAVTGIAAT